MPIMLHTPGPEQARSSMAWNSARSISPARNRPMASFTSQVTHCLPPHTAGSIAPPVKNTVGKLHRAAAMSMPGTILSHEQTITAASNPCALTINSTDAAITSRRGRM